MFKVSVKTKRCATCNNWGGERRPSPDQKFVLVEDQATEGQCFGRYKPFKKKAKDYCPYWERYHLLNEKSIPKLIIEINEFL